MIESCVVAAAVALLVEDLQPMAHRVCPLQGITNGPKICLLHLLPLYLTFIFNASPVQHIRIIHRSPTAIITSCFPVIKYATQVIQGGKDLHENWKSQTRSRDQVPASLASTCASGAYN